MRQIVALDEFHHQRANAATFLETVDVCDVWMVQRCEHLRLAAEPRETIQIVRDGGQQDIGAKARADSLIYRGSCRRSPGIFTN